MYEFLNHTKDYDKVIEKKKFTPFWCEHCVEFKKEVLDTNVLNNLFQQVYDYAKDQTLDSLSFDKISEIQKNSEITKYLDKQPYFSIYELPPQTSERFTFTFHIGGTECKGGQCSFLDKIQSKNCLNTALKAVALQTILYDAKYIPNTATIKPFVKCYTSYGFSRSPYRFKPLDWEFNMLLHYYQTIKLGKKLKYECFDHNHKYKKLLKYKDKFKIFEQNFEFNDGSNYSKPKELYFHTNLVTKLLPDKLFVLNSRDIGKYYNYAGGNQSLSYYYLYACDMMYDSIPYLESKIIHKMITDKLSIDISNEIFSYLQPKLYHYED